MPVAELKERLKKGETVLMDGAMGSEISNRGVSTKLPLWSADALITHPEVVQQIHEDYIRAGAEIIITNTFSTTDRIVKRGDAKQSGRDLTLLACRLARQARDAVKVPQDVYIAGSVAPLEDCYSPELTPPDAELAREHTEFAQQLREGGVDFILVETMITLRETLAALKAAQEAGLPVAVSFCCNDKEQLLSGDPLSEVVPEVEKFDPLFIGVNCVSPAIAAKTVKALRKLTNRPVSVYAQGEGEPDDDEGWRVVHGETAPYVKIAAQWKADGAGVIGGCCGTTPEHTAELKKLLAAKG